MNICNEHDGEEIAFEDGNGIVAPQCPACNQVEELEEEIEQLEAEVASLRE